MTIVNLFTTLRAPGCYKRFLFCGLRNLPGLIATFLAGWAIFNTVFNNTYHYGSTVFDDCFWSTSIWRSGWTLRLAPAFGNNVPFYITHSSPIQYIPDLFSYIFPWDFITYYALVYVIFCSGMVLVAYWLIKPLVPGPQAVASVVAALCAFAVFCSQIIYDGLFSMHMEIMSPVLAMLAFRAWQLRRYWQAMLWFTLNASIREDVGVLFCGPLGLLALIQFLQLRKADAALARERLRWGIILVVWSVLWACMLYVVPRMIWDVYDVFHARYYPKGHPFAHLSPQKIYERFSVLFGRRRGISLPLVSMLAGSLVLRDATIAAGTIGFLPYITVLFLAQPDLTAEIGIYLPFLLGVTMVWPALMALTQPPALWKRYLGMQLVVLACGLSYITQGTIDDAHRRWILQPYGYNSAAYLDFGRNRLDREMTGRAFGSVSVMAIYPYQFPAHWESDISRLPIEKANAIDTLIWFENDPDQKTTDEFLACGNYETVTVPDTKIHISHKKFKPQGAPSK